MAFPLWSQGLFNALFFGVYESVRMTLDGGVLPSNQLNYGSAAVAAAVAGGVQAIPCTPLELAKIKLQNQTGIVRLPIAKIINVIAYTVDALILKLNVCCFRKAEG